MCYTTLDLEVNLFCKTYKSLGCIIFFLLGYQLWLVSMLVYNLLVSGGFLGGSDWLPDD